MAQWAEPVYAADWATVQPVSDVQYTQVSSHVGFRKNWGDLIVSNPTFQVSFSGDVQTPGAMVMIPFWS